jgi:hypothetical protein
MARKKGLSMRAGKGVPVAVAMARDAIARGMDKEIARVLAGDVRPGDELTVRNYLALAERELERARV